MSLALSKTLLPAPRWRPAAAALLAVVPVCWQGGSAPPTLTGIDARISPFSGSQLLATAGLRASCTLDRARRQVVVTWKHAPAGDPVPSVDAMETQRFGTRFVPLTADFVNPDKLLVAGLTSRDEVVVELWELPVPDVLKLADGSLALATWPQASIRTVYASDRGERGLVEMMVGNRGAAGHSFVRFSDADALYDLDWSSADPVEPTVALPATDEPALRDRRYHSLTGATHASQGYVYKLLYELLPPDGAPLVLIDTDRDGTIDVHAPMSAAQMEPAGLLDASQYEEIGNLPVE